MSENTLREMLKELMRQGLHIEMFMEADGRVWYDLNTGMKSHLHVSYNKIEETIEYKGRYEAYGHIEDMQDLLWTVRRCDHGRGFANGIWHEILGKGWSNE